MVRIGDDDYYCLFYREVHPVGWNIANGGSATLHELLHPSETIEREFREELLVAEPRDGRRYIFDWNTAGLADHPDFATAWHLWEDVFRKRGFPSLEKMPLPMKWIPGYDSVSVCFTKSQTQGVREFVTSGCILNINAEDFGIEVDRVAKVEVGPNAVLCDGETVPEGLLNRVIGLFEVGSFNEALSNNRDRFEPQRVFWYGKERKHDNLEAVISDYLDYAVKNGVRHSDVKARHGADPNKYGLCPVTRTVVKRCLHLLQQDDSFPRKPPRRHLAADEVFLSFNSADRGLARKVSDFLKSKGLSVFFSKETLAPGDFGRRIDEALDGARALVVVSTRLEHMMKRWVSYEWQSFHNDILSGRKAANAVLRAFVVGIDPQDLPRPLRSRQAITCNPRKPQPALRQLAKWLSE